MKGSFSSVATIRNVDVDSQRILKIIRYMWVTNKRSIAVTSKKE